MGILSLGWFVYCVFVFLKFFKEFKSFNICNVNIRIIKFVFYGSELLEIVLVIIFEWVSICMWVCMYVYICIRVYGG